MPALKRHKMKRKALSKRKKAAKQKPKATTKGKPSKPKPKAAPGSPLPVTTAAKAGPGERTDPAKRNVIGVGLLDDVETYDRAIARTLTKPSVTAAGTIQAWETGHEVNALISELTEQIKLVHDGNLQRAEGLLTAQAHTLDAIFNKMARRAADNMTAGYRDTGDIYLRLALRAQGQCRATLETLAEVKNPLMGAYVRQANIAKGHQQVNNGAESHAHGKIESTPNKLLEVTDAERLDTGAAGAAIVAHKEMATVGEVHRPADGSGEGASLAQPVQGGHAEGVAGAAAAPDRARAH